MGYNVRVDKTALQMITPVAAAFVGDAVHTLYIRQRIVDGGLSTGTLHITASKFVNAGAQAKVFDELMARGEFTDDEADIARRAKNAHLHSRAKTASSEDYHKATALEAVIGYLELAGDCARRDHILSLCAALSGLDELISSRTTE